MSLIEKPKKEKKTADLTEYYKEYRDKHRTHINRLEKVKYYKDRYNLEAGFIKKFGEFSADVYKLHKDFITIKEQCPALIPHILTLLDTEIDEGKDMPTNV
jgi:hypothetical protein